ncbi:MAG: hypothetical protein R3A80_07120 [Bdellovibrionota bacterium]
MIKKCLLSLALISCFSASAADSGDILIHATGGWNQDLELFQGRGEVAYSFWNDFSIGPVIEFNRYYYTPALGITWHLEPFEILAHTGPLFWEKDGNKRTTIQFSIHANYLMQITTHFQFFVSAGANLPDKYFRGVPLGAGLRYWF